MQKLDPYINVDPGTMNPFEHGEVFVTDDGARPTSTSATMSASSTRTSPEGLQRDHRVDLPGGAGQPTAGDYLGKTVQVIPHITDEIKRASSGSPPTTSTSSSPRSAAPSATSRSSRSSRPSGSSATRSAGQRLLRARDPGALHRAVRRAEDQADAALGHRAAQPGHPARRHRLPQRLADLRALKRKISNLCDVPVSGGHRRRRPEPLRDPLGAARGGPRHGLCRLLGLPEEVDLSAGRRSSPRSTRPCGRCASA